MEKPSLEEVKEYFKDAAKIKDHAGDIGFLEADKLEFTILGDGIIQNTGRPNWLVLWCSDEGYAKILTYKNTEPKFEITKEQILELSKDAHPSVVGQLKEWFPEVFEDNLVVGEWYKTFHETGSCLFRFNGEFDKENCPKGYGFDSEKKYRVIERSGWGFKGCNPRKATTEEVTEALKKEAVKRGYKEGVWINRDLMHVNTDTIIIPFGKDYFFDDKYNVFYLNRREVFSKGIWAEIIPTKTIQEAEKLLKELGHEIKIV